MTKMTYGVDRGIADTTRRGGGGKARPTMLRVMHSPGLRRNSPRWYRTTLELSAAFGGGITHGLVYGPTLGLALPSDKTVANSPWASWRKLAFKRSSVDDDLRERGSS